MNKRVVFLLNYHLSCIGVITIKAHMHL